jgi:uncharacterized protein (TIGR02118 family)
MPEQYKKIAFLAPRPGLDDPAFRRYWRETHGPLVASSPGYATYRQRYVQNHLLAPGPIGKSVTFAGMAEFWLPGDNEDVFASTSIYRDRIHLDELQFIDMDGTVSFTAQEQVLKPDRGRAKLVVLSGRNRALGLSEFRTRYTSVYAASALRVQGFAGRLQGWRADHVVEGSFRLPGARSVSALPIDCAQSFWFDSALEIAAAFASLDDATRAGSIDSGIFSTVNCWSFQAENRVFFDQGLSLA